MKFAGKPWFRVTAALAVAALFYHSWIVNLNKDFDIFIEAAKLVFKGESPYEKWLGTAGLKYYYSPFFAMLLFPLKDAPQLLYAFIWTALNFFLVFRIFRLLVILLAGTGVSLKQTGTFILLCLVCSLRFILDNLGLGQMTIVLVWAALEIVRLELKDRSVAAGALLALVINIKLIPIALLAWCLYKGRWKLALSTVATSLLLLLIPAAVWGWSFNASLHDAWLNSLTQTSVNSITEDDNRPGLSSLIPSLTMETPQKFGMQRNFVELDPMYVQWITNGARFLFVVIGVLMISRPLKPWRNTWQAFHDVSVVCLLTPLVFPHQGKYALLYTLPAYAICIRHLIAAGGPWMNNRPLSVLLAASFALLTLTTDGVITRPGSDFAEYYHLLTYGTFFLLAALWITGRALAKNEWNFPDLSRDP